MQRSINASYAAFYHDIALHPEVGRFRRFAAQFAKKLYDDTEEVLLKESAVNDALAQVWGRDRGVTVLDVPRSFVEANCAKDPEIVKNLRLKEQWNSYEQALVKYGQTLCLSQQVLNLPHQAPYAAERLSDYHQVFEKRVVDPTSEDAAVEKRDFGPTSEDAAVYQKPSHLTDTCAWRIPSPRDVLTSGDILTTLLINHRKWIERHILSRLRRPFHRRKRNDETVETNMKYNRIVETVDAITCVFVPLLLTATMFALVEVGRLRVRIAVIGVFGLIFSISVKAIAGHLTRGEVFSATAAFFAVASVFVGSTSNKGAD